MNFGTVWTFCSECLEWVEIPKETMKFYSTHRGGEFCRKVEAECPQCGHKVGIDARVLDDEDWRKACGIKNK